MAVEKRKRSKDKERLVRILRKYFEDDNLFTNRYLKGARGELIRDLIAWKYDK